MFAFCLIQACVQCRREFLTFPKTFRVWRISSAATDIPHKKQFSGVRSGDLGGQ